MQRITKAQLQAAKELEAAMDPSQVPASKMKAPYNNAKGLLTWVIDVRKELVSVAADLETGTDLLNWITEPDNTKSIIPFKRNLIKFIALAAIPNPAEFTPELFPMFTDPEETITGMIPQKSWDNARILYENESWKAGTNTAKEDTAASQTAASSTATPAGNTAASTATAAAATGSGTTNTAGSTVYVAIPSEFSVTGKRAPGDYMQQLADLGYTFRKNEVTNRVEVNGIQLDDFLFSEICTRMEENGLGSERKITNYINVIANTNSYHPIKDYFNSLTWDGTEVLDSFAALLDPEDPIFAGVIFRKWMISVVAKVMEHKQNTMLVLEGGQGTGKSQLVRWLCPLGSKYFREAAIQPDNKDHEIAACSKWIWEVKELASTTRRADQDALKGFLSTGEFNYRPPFGRWDTTRPALASFIGTVNNSSGFLVDVTGNRRFWIIKTGANTGKINWDYETLYNVNDLWAEAYARWKRGDRYTLTAEENAALSENQKQYEVTNMTAEALAKYYDIDPAKVNDPGWNIRVIDIKQHLKDCGLSETDLNSRRLGDAAKELGITSKKEKRNGSTVTVYYGIQQKIITT